MAGSPQKRARREAAEAAGMGTNGASYGGGRSRQLGAGLPIYPRAALGVAHAPRLPAVAAAEAARAAAAQPPAPLPAPAPQAPSQPAAPPPAAVAAPPPSAEYAPPPTAAQADDGTAYQRFATERDDRLGIGRGLQPTTLLTSHWGYLVLTRRIPPAAMFITLRGCPQGIAGQGAPPMYDLQVPGELVECTRAGVRNPAAALQEWVNRNRRYPDQHEFFEGIVQGYHVQKGYEPLGGGNMSLPPDPQAHVAPAAPAWSAPPSGYAQGYGMPPPGFGAPAGYGAGWPGWPQPGGMPPNPWALMGMMPPVMQPQAPQPPPPAPAGMDAQSLSIWKMQTELYLAQQRQNSEMQMAMFQQMAKAQASAATGPAAAAADPMDSAMKIVNLASGLANLQRPAESTTPQIQIIRPDADTTLIATDGKIDATMTAGLMVKDAVKGFGSILKNRVQKSAAAGGAHAPRVPGTTNGAAGGGTP